MLIRRGTDLNGVMQLTPHGLEFPHTCAARAQVSLQLGSTCSCIRNLGSPAQPQALRHRLLLPQPRQLRVQTPVDLRLAGSEARFLGFMCKGFDTVVDF